MDHFNYHLDGRLLAEECPIEDLLKKVGTPTYIYSRATIERHWKAFENAAGTHAHLICYAVKANSNLAILNLMARMGSGFDIVSVGELMRVLKAGGEASKVVFSGVAKTEIEIATALKEGIFCFNVESSSELKRINSVAKAMGKIAPISIRINPNIDAGTHPYISTGLKENKFGIEIEEALKIYQLAATLSCLEIKGVDCHIGSQLTELSPFIEALEKLLALIDELEIKGIHISHLDLGGGLGIAYKGEVPPTPAEYLNAVLEKVGDRNLTLIFEPGRAILGNAGILAAKVEFLKLSDHKNFAIVDAGMNDLMRPSLYSAWQEIIPVQKPGSLQGEGAENSTGNTQSIDRVSRVYDVVGPVCETSDFLGKERALAIAEGDYLAVRGAGAYGASMGSNYNSRCRAAEILVDGDKAFVIKEREKYIDLWKGESVLPED